MSVEDATQAALAALAQRRIAELWESTLSLLERGKAEDDRGAYAAARLLYSEAIGGLQTLIELETGERRVALLNARLKEYCARLQEYADAPKVEPSPTPALHRQMRTHADGGRLCKSASAG